MNIIRCTESSNYWLLIIIILLFNNYWLNLIFIMLKCQWNENVLILPVKFEIINRLRNDENVTKLVNKYGIDKSNHCLRRRKAKDWNSKLKEVN